MQCFLNFFRENHQLCIKLHFTMALVFFSQSVKHKHYSRSLRSYKQPGQQWAGALSRKWTLGPWKSSLPVDFTPNFNRGAHHVSCCHAQKFPPGSSMDLQACRVTPVALLLSGTCLLHLSWFQSHKLIRIMFQRKLPLGFGTQFFQHTMMNNLNFLQTIPSAVLIN